MNSDLQHVVLLVFYSSTVRWIVRQLLKYSTPNLFAKVADEVQRFEWTIKSKQFQYHFSISGRNCNCNFTVVNRPAAIRKSVKRANSIKQVTIWASRMEVGYIIRSLFEQADSREANESYKTRLSPTIYDRVETGFSVSRQMIPTKHLQSSRDVQSLKSPENQR